MATAREQATTPVSTYDYLDEDAPIRRQNFACISFLSPEDVIEERKMFIMKDFLFSFSSSMTTMMDHLRTKFPTEGEEIDAIMQAHPTIFKPSEIGAELVTYSSINKDALEKKFEEAHQFTTSVRGVKVRGVFDTRDEAEKHIKRLKKSDPNFDIFMCEVGKWCPWAPCAEDIADVEYNVTHLNTLMQGYKSNMDDRDEAYEEDTRERVKRVQANAKLNLKKIAEEESAVQTVSEEIVTESADHQEVVETVPEPDTYAIIS